MNGHFLPGGGSTVWYRRTDSRNYTSLFERLITRDNPFLSKRARWTDCNDQSIRCRAGGYDCAGYSARSPTQRSSARAQRSSARAQRSSTRAQRSSTRAQRSSARAQRSSTRAQRSGTRAQRSGTRAQRSGARAQRSGARAQRSGARARITPRTLEKYTTMVFQFKPFVFDP